MTQPNSPGGRPGPPPSMPPTSMPPTGMPPQGTPPHSMPPRMPPPYGAPGPGPQFLPPYPGPAPMAPFPGAAAPSGGSTGAVWLLGIAALVGVVLGISLVEDGHSQWHSVHAWGGLAIAGAALTLAPVAAAGLGSLRAWRCAVVGAAALIVYWALFVLPAVGSNTSLITTVGVAAGVCAAWLAPGRPAAPARPPSW